MKKTFLICIIFLTVVLNAFAQISGVAAENSPLLFGNPSGAVAELTSAENYLIEKPQFALSYNSQKLIPNWVMWHLSTQDFGEADRSNDFRPDADLPAEFYSVTKADYQFTIYGFDRGHVCPSADRTSSQSDNSITFLMTNMIPQTPDLNRIVWKDFESFERQIAKTGKEIYIVAGQNGQGGSSGAGRFTSIKLISSKGAGKEITVPAYCWKILLVLPEGTEDLSRVTADITPIAVYIPNEKGVHKNGSWQAYLCSVDYIEEQTGYDFFDLLPDEIEDAIEAKVYEP